ncbi:hypothetical protein CAPTEDRAFT_211613 [Capitella teleta]|uniref:Endonuclease/exonuclease/phosphatase domain-containing protein n=1 Tax=Capitella teleta TaxID=283909 RepID=R7UP79_CAPTE|nr:hypothetical protein CAPTEDRAFT_211613 [Capitella teleta]|eukprot:ELU05201.1 hypothetical protein CAPTEDRAFT_211613 [Capitella teleta]
MVKYIVKVNISNPKCIMLKLQLFPKITLVSCYIAPSDFPYHSFAPLSEIQERVSENDDEKFILIGDLNARFGNECTAFIEGKNFSVPTHNALSPNPVTSSNVNARYAIESLCDYFVLLNGLCPGSSTHKTALTFRRRNHVPISCCIALNRLECSRNIQPLKNRAEELARPSTQQDLSNNVSLHRRRMIKMSQIDPQLAADALNTTPHDLTSDDTDTIVDEVNNMLYNIASNARIITSPAAQRTDAYVRLKDLLENNESHTLWKAVNWNGSIASPEKKDIPNNDAFQVHF